jgi:GNAT superfamily N-acetyltransferase
MMQNAVSVTIRVATIEDQASLVSLINQAFAIETFLDGERTSAPEIQAMFGNGEFLVAIANDITVALVYTEVRGERGYFWMLSVSASRQGTGLGRTVIHAAKQHCRSKGCKRMELTVLSLRADLPPLYRKFGYHETGREPFHTTRHIEGNQPCELILMSKQLRNGMPRHRCARGILAAEKPFHTFAARADECKVRPRQAYVLRPKFYGLTFPSREM